MEDKLIRALEATGLPVFNLERPEGNKNCIVYNYAEQVKSYEDNEESVVKYTIYVNLVIQKGLNKTKNLIKENMRSEAFRVQYIPPAYKDVEFDFIQQAFTFTFVETI